MFATKIPTGAPTDLAVLLRMPDKPLPYRIGLRCLDVISGRRDGQRHLGGPLQDLYLLPQEATAWQRHTSDLLDDRRAAEDITYQSLALPLTTRATQLVSAISAAEEALRDAEEALEKANDRSPYLTGRRATEGSLSPEQVAKRRSREHESAVVAPARAQVTRARTALDALQSEQHQAQATLTALEDVVQSRKDRLTEFHQRRAHAYERSYLRHANHTPPRPRLKTTPSRALPAGPARPQAR